MKGLEEAKKFYEEAGAEMISRNFGDFENRIAVGLVGHGSECFGFDDQTSRDHDFETGFCLWLTKDDEEKIGFYLMRAYDKLKEEYALKNGVDNARSSVESSAFKGVFTIDVFYRRYTGSDGAPIDWQEWLYTDSFFFAEATNGEVFRDDLGEFTKIRNEILHGMPEDVRIKKIGSCALRAAQSGQYNYARCIKHGEDGAAMLALGEFVKSACELAFLLEKRHMPYYKWAIRQMRSLVKFGSLADTLEFLLTADNDESGKRVKREIVEDVCGAFAKEMNEQFELKIEGNYLEPFGYAIQKRIKNADIRNLHVIL